MNNVITAAMVSKLSHESNEPMMKCKKALDQANGNYELAKIVLQQRNDDYGMLVTRRPPLPHRAPVDIPAEIIEAAYKVSRWFEERNITEWTLGEIQSRTNMQKVLEGALNQGTGAYRITADMSIARMSFGEMRNDSTTSPSASDAPGSLQTHPEVPPVHFAPPDASGPQPAQPETPSSEQ